MNKIRAFLFFPLLLGAAAIAARASAPVSDSQAEAAGDGVIDAMVYRSAQDGEDAARFYRRAVDSEKDKKKKAALLCKIGIVLGDDTYLLTRDSQPDWSRSPARKAYLAALDLEPDLAMAYWGLATTEGCCDSRSSNCVKRCGRAIKRLDHAIELAPKVSLFYVTRLSYKLKLLARGGPTEGQAWQRVGLPECKKWLSVAQDWDMHYHQALCGNIFRKAGMDAESESVKAKYGRQKAALGKRGNSMQAYFLRVLGYSLDKDREAGGRD